MRKFILLVALIAISCSARPDRPDEQDYESTPVEKRETEPVDPEDRVKGKEAIDLGLEGNDGAVNVQDSGATGDEEQEEPQCVDATQCDALKKPGEGSWACLQGRCEFQLSAAPVIAEVECEADAGCADRGEGWVCESNRCVKETTPEPPE